ncbi:MAG: hypothetical protein AAF346_09665, partial [Pseudomonadota bacterium]
MLLPSTAVRHRDMFGIILVVPLKFEEVIVPAAFFVGKLATNGGTGTVHRATACIGVEKSTDPPEVLVLFASHNAFVAVV